MFARKVRIDDLEFTARELEIDRLQRDREYQAEFRLQAEDDLRGFNDDFQAIVDEEDPFAAKDAFRQFVLKYGRYKVLPEVAEQITGAVSVLEGDLTDRLAVHQDALKEKGRLSQDKAALVETYPDDIIAEVTDPRTGQPLFIATDEIRPEVEAEREYDRLVWSTKIREALQKGEGVSDVIADPEFRSALIRNPGLQEDVNEAIEREAKGINLTAAEREVFSSILSVSQDLDELEKALDNEEFVGPVVGAIRSRNPYDKSARRINNSIIATVP